MLKSLGVEDFFGVLGVVALGILVVVAVRATNAFSLGVSGDGSCGITSVVHFGFPRIVTVEFPGKISI